MIMAVKETRLLSQLDNISKTKIRGVLALFKQGQLFLTHGEEGEAVQLFFNESIRSFKELRDQHDTFVIHWMNINHLFVPNHLKSEIVWQLDSETKTLRLEELKGLEVTIEHFFLSGGHIPYKTFPSNSNVATPSTTSRSSFLSPTAGLSSRYDFNSAPVTSVLPAPSLSVPTSGSPVPVLTVPKAFGNGGGVGGVPTMTIPSTVSLSPIPDQQNYNVSGRPQSHQRQQEFNNLPSSYPTTSGMPSPALQLPPQQLPFHREHSGGSRVNRLSHSLSLSSPRETTFQSSVVAPEFIPGRRSDISAMNNGEIDHNSSWYKGTEGLYGDQRTPPPLPIPATTPSPPIYDGRSTNFAGSSSTHSPRQEQQQHHPEHLYGEVYQHDKNDPYYPLQTERSAHPTVYNYDEQQHQQGQSQYPNYSPTADIRQQLRSNPNLPYPVGSYPPTDPATGGFMNRHYRPNRNKTNSESSSNQESSSSNNSSQQMMKSYDMNNLSGNKSSNEDLSKLTSTSRKSSSSFSVTSSDALNHDDLVHKNPSSNYFDFETRNNELTSHHQGFTMSSMEIALNSLVSSSQNHFLNEDHTPPLPETIQMDKQEQELQEFKG
jgi:hypothetical protein